MKTCFKCGLEQDLSEFYKHAQMKDGHINKCKTCAKSDSRQHGSNTEYDRRRNKLPHRVAARAAYQKTEAGKASQNKSKKKYIDKNPVKRKAHQMVSNAVRDKKLFKEPC